MHLISEFTLQSSLTSECLIKNLKQTDSFEGFHACDSSAAPDNVSLRTDKVGFRLSLNLLLCE